MQAIQGFVGRRLSTILLLLLAGGFALTLGELLLTGHSDGIQVVGPVASALGLVAVLVGLVARGGLRIGMVVVLLVLSLAGLVGTLQHWEEGGERGEVGLSAGIQTIAFETSRTVSATQQDDDERGGERESEGTPPPLAPLSLAGLGLMGAVVLLARGVPAVPGPRDAKS